jgi:ABC-type sulfate transport system permease component
LDLIVDLFFAIGNIIIGVALLIIGFKIFNPLKGRTTPEKEKIWYDKYGTMLKLIGAIVFLLGISKLIRNSF